MATASTSNDREFLFRLQTLIIDGGCDALRNMFDQNLNNVPLDVLLGKERTVINRLRSRGTITNAQYDLLFPPSGQPPDSANFDITLIICLLRNIKSFGLNPRYSWNSTPLPGDIMVEDDICRLKGFRNEIAHISSTRTFNQASFQSKWADIEQVLQRLNSAIPSPVPDLKQTLDSYKHSPLEPGAEQRIQADIDNWRDMEKALEVEMKLLKEDIKSLQKEVKEGFEKVKEGKELMKDDVKGLQKDLNDASKDVKGVKESLWKVNTDVGEVKDNVETMKEYIRKLEEQVKVKETKGGNIQVLQDDLISFYRDQHGTISLSPLIEKNTPLLEFYVMPDIYSLKLHGTLSDVKQEKTVVTQIRNVFYNDNKMCRKIYLTADAGLGKTALSKRLTLAWCHANKPNEDEKQYFSAEEIQAVNEFRFVFLLLLRNCSSECDTDDFIMHQIISRLGHDYTRGDLVNILCKERCLVILDGLDEWSHPSNSCKQGSSPIPHRRVRERTVVLTTTRPWKLSVSDLQSSQIDQKLEILGLNQKSANLLKRSVISYLCNEKNENNLQNRIKRFTKAVAEKQMSDLETIPLLLMYLLFLWCNRIEIGQSQCDLYSQITELLLSRTVKNYESPKVDLSQGDIPTCLSGKTHSKQFFTILIALGQLAYQTLFRETREENTLVFDGSVAEQYFNKDSLNFCLKTGLLTQSKVPGTLLEQKSKVSFAHKTVQEFFAALYMHSTSDQTSVPEIVLSKCKCIKDILEMSKILKFICGMNVNVSSLISREMTKFINEDEITLEYRSTLDRNVYRNPLKDFQDMCISCCREIPRENEISFCLQDVFIEESCQQEQYREYLKQLTTRNKQNIRSLYIDMYKMSKTPYKSVHEVIDYFALSDLENIEKIHYEGDYNDRDILPLFNKSVKCLHLSCRELGYWSRLLFEKVTSLQKLEAININGFEMSHSELTLLYDYISHRHCMRHIVLEYLSCAEHWDSCSVCLELSHHSQLNTLDLRFIPVSELNINMASLEKCHLKYLSNPDLVLRFINCVPANSKLNTFVCWRLESPVAIETMLETLRLSVHIKHVTLWKMNLGNSEVLTPEMVNIEYVYLFRVTMTASVLQGIVDLVQQQQQQTITVNIEKCDIKPESEFIKVKQKIKTSREHFRIVYDSKYWFWFETIKQRD